MTDDLDCKTAPGVQLTVARCGSCFCGHTHVCTLRHLYRHRSRTRIFRLINATTADARHRRRPRRDAGRTQSIGRIPACLTLIGRGCRPPGSSGGFTHIDQGRRVHRGIAHWVYPRQFRLHFAACNDTGTALCSESPACLNITPVGGIVVRVVGCPDERLHRGNFTGTGSSGFRLSVVNVLDFPAGTRPAATAGRSALSERGQSKCGKDQ